MDEGALVGMVTVEGLHWAKLPKGIGLDLASITDKLSKMTIHQMMTKEVKTISPDASLMDAARLMLKHRINALPVINKDELAGIITESDIFRVCVELDEKN
jgi:CBS domain-containing protein